MGAAPQVVAIIPARLGSQRFPGKVLADRTGKPLIRHVCEAAVRAQRVERVVVATDDRRVADAVASFGGEAVMTDAAHPNGTSRLSQAAALLALPPDALIVNVQGDEPELEPDVIDAAIESRAALDADVGTAACPIDPSDRDNPNVVKVVTDARGSALYFSRAAIPYTRDPGTPHAAMLRHVGVYVYSRSFLDQYVRLPQTPLEQAEQLEQLRVLEHGGRIGVAVVGPQSAGIDTPEQYEAFVARLRASGGRGSA